MTTKNIGHRYYRPIYDFKYRYWFKKKDIGRSLLRTFASTSGV